MSTRYFHEPWRILDDGSLGFFWPCEGSSPPDVENDAACLRGYIRRTGDTVTADMLVEDVAPSDWLRSPPPPPPVLAAVLTTGGGLLHHIVGTSAATRIGGASSSRSLRGRIYIGGVALQELRSTSPLGLTAPFAGMSRWAGQDSIDEDFEPAADGSFDSYVLRLSYVEEQAVALGDGRELTMRPDWHMIGPSDRRSVLTRLSFGCRAETAEMPHRLLHPLLAVEDLLSLVHDEPVIASQGSAHMDYPVGDDDERRLPGWFWSGTLMERHPSFAETPEHPALPLVGLEALGGLPGIARWVSLCETHPRATTAAVRLYREGPLSATVALLEVAAGIEYWVRINKAEDWAGRLYAQNLARFVGPQFDRWVGGSDRWGRLFWSTYNALKHRPDDQRPGMIAGPLAESGRWLLAAGLLCHVAGDLTPAEQLFGGGMLTRLGDRIRDVVQAA